MSLEKDLTVARNLVAMARRRPKGKSANTRSRMLKMVMPHLSRENGDRLAKAIGENNPGEFSAVWDRIKKEIRRKLEKRHHESNSAVAVTIPVSKHSSNFNVDKFLCEMHDLVVEEMESTSVDYNFHDYSNVLLGRGKVVDKTREFVANGSCTLKGRKGNYMLVTTSIKTSGSPNTELLSNVELQVEAALIDKVEQKTIKTFREKGPMAVAATEILLKASSLAGI